MNISNIHSIHSCTSCQVCAAVCPENAIGIQLNAKGFYAPYVDEVLCTDCSSCTKVCYKFNEVELTNTDEEDLIDIYAASAKDNEIIKSTSSGGIARLLCDQFLADGYKCVGVVYDKVENRAFTCITDNQEDSLKFNGSKYIQSYTFDAFKKLLRDRIDEKMAVFGTPCQIYAIDLYLKQRNARNNFILVDFFCTGCPSLKLWQKYLTEIIKNNKISDFKTVEFRSKIKGWHKFIVTLKSGIDKFEFISNSNNNEFYELFFSRYLLNNSCTDCQLRSTVEYTDFRLGDFWGKSYDKNTRGVSIATLCSDTARRYFAQISNKMDFRKHKFSDILPFQSWGVSYRLNDTLRNRLFKMLCEDRAELKNIVAYYHKKQSLKQKIKRSVKNTILLFPEEWLKRVRQIFHYFQ